MTVRLIHHENLRLFSQEVLMKMGASEDDAYHVADNLVTSNLRGIDSHGVGRLKRYVEGIQSGYILPAAQPVIERDSDVIANINAMNGLGQPAGAFGMRVAIEKATHTGVGIVTVHQLEAGTSQPRRATLEVIRRAFETAGVEFIEENGGGPGVRLRKRQRAKASKT